MSINKVILLGYLGDEPKTIHFNDGQTSTVRIATNTIYTNRNNEKHNRLKDLLKKYDISVDVKKIKVDKKQYDFFKKKF